MKRAFAYYIEHENKGRPFILVGHSQGTFHLLPLLEQMIDQTELKDRFVAGYAIGHDLSARDLQMELPAGQWMIGKTLDGFAPIGPYFVSADVVGNPGTLQLTTRVNGVQVQNDNTSDLIFSVPQLIAYISKHWTLQAGDIIFTGTPAGVIHGRPKAQQQWLKAGDEIVSSVDKLGELHFKLG